MRFRLPAVLAKKFFFLSHCLDLVTKKILNLGVNIASENMVFLKFNTPET